MKNLSTLTVSIALALCLTACGGGSGDDTTVTPTTPTTPTMTIEDEFGSYLTDLANNHIMPGYQDFNQQSIAFNQAAQSFCSLTNATDTDLETLKAAWLSNNHSWQNIQWLKVGPVVDMLFRIQLWPDSNSAIDRAIATHLLEPDTITAELIAAKNVGGQGLPAAESLLYPIDSDDDLLSSDIKEKRCELITAIAQNLENMSTDINNAWQASGDNYVNTLITGTGEFSSKQDAVEELITNWLEQIEKVKDEKILTPLADEAPGLATLAEHSLSDQSLASIKINIASFQALYDAGTGHGFDDILNDFVEQQSVATSMQEKITSAQTAISLLEGSYSDALNNEEKRLILEEVIIKLRELRDLFTAEFVQVLDLNIGFNSNDGD